MSDKLIERIVKYAEATESKSSDIVSLKLRPVQGGAQYTDPFGRQDSNGYLYTSEYSAGKDVANIKEVPETLTHIGMIGRSVGHPSPWSSEPKDFIFSFTDTNPPTLWIQHETGLEILGAVSAIIGIITGTITIWEKIRGKVFDNTKSSDTDRYWKEIKEIRVELRQVNEAHQLNQELIYSERIEKQIETNELLRMLSERLKK